MPPSAPGAYTALLSGNRRRDPDWLGSGRVRMTSTSRRLQAGEHQHARDSSAPATILSLLALCSAMATAAAHRDSRTGPKPHRAERARARCKIPPSNFATETAPSLLSNNDWQDNPPRLRKSPRWAWHQPTAVKQPSSRRFRRVSTLHCSLGSTRRPALALLKCYDAGGAAAGSPSPASATSQ